VPEVAVLHLHTHFYAHNEPLFNYGTAAQPVEGALHALLETQRSTDVLTEDAAVQRMHSYKLVVVPEQTRLSAQLVMALEAYAAGGGHVLLTGAHVASDYPALAGVTADGEPIGAAIYLPVDGRAVSVSSPWQPVNATGNTEVWTYRLRQQEPDKDMTGEAVVTRRRVGAGSIIVVHGPIFRDYLIGHYPDLRRFIGALVDRLQIAWTVTVEAPPRLELILRRKDQRLLINLINRGAGEMHSPQRVIVEELLPVENVTVRVRRDTAPKSISVVPKETQMDWTYAKGLLQVHLPQVEIHSVVVVEE
jgi:hypothetical protein